MSTPASLTRQGMENQLAKIISGWLAVDVWAHLIGVAGLAITETTTLSDCLTFESSFIGYAPQKLTTWATPSLQFGSGGLSEYGLTSAPAAWSITDPSGSGNLYGYFLTDGASSLLYGATEFDPPIPIDIPTGESFNLTVEYLLFSYFPYPPVPLP
jgi:hypothetical protein